MLRKSIFATLQVGLLVTSAGAASLSTSGQTLYGTVFGEPFTILDTQTGGASLTYNYTFSAGESSGRAQAEFGALRGAATLNITNGSDSAPGPSYGLTLSAESLDTLLISIPGSPGQAGQATFTYTITGSTSASGDAGLTALAGVQLTIGSNAPQFVNFGPFPTNLSGSIAFVSGVPFSFNTIFRTVADVGAVTNAFPYQATISADFFNTAQLSRIELFSQDGTPINGFSITSESRTRYTAAGASPVPEPGSFVLVALGFLPAIYLKRVMKRKAD